jgi:hypothetical protein
MDRIEDLTISRFKMNYNNIYIPSIVSQILALKVFPSFKFMGAFFNFPFALWIFSRKKKANGLLDNKMKLLSA